MIADDASCVHRGYFDDVRRFRIGIVVAGTGQSGFEKAVVAKSGGATMQSQKAIVNGEGVALFNPERFFSYGSHSYLARARNVLR